MEVKGSRNERHHVWGQRAVAERRGAGDKCSHGLRAGAHCHSIRTPRGPGPGRVTVTRLRGEVNSRSFLKLRLCDSLVFTRVSTPGISSDADRDCVHVLMTTPSTPRTGNEAQCPQAGHRCGQFVLFSKRTVSLLLFLYFSSFVCRICSKGNKGVKHTKMF